MEHVENGFQEEKKTPNGKKALLNITKAVNFYLNDRRREWQPVKYGLPQS